MKSASIKEIKKELLERSPNEVMDLCLRLCRFKKENKELLTYLLFEAYDEEQFISSVKQEIDERFKLVNRKSPYFVRKSFRSILQLTRKFIRYSGKKETEIELLLYFSLHLKNFQPDISRNKRQFSLYQKLLEQITKKVFNLHEDLQYDYLKELESTFGLSGLNE